MIKFYSKIYEFVVFCTFIFLTGFLFSQTQNEKEIIKSRSNQTFLKQFSLQKKNEFNLIQQKIDSLSRIYGWKKTIKIDSTFSQLVGLTKENKPIYYITHNRGAGVTTRADRLYTGGSLGLSVEGQNMTAGIWDGGAVLVTHEIFNNRVTVIDGTTGLSSHSTHVTGTIIGNDQVQNGSARGMAFRANALSSDWNSDLSEVSTAASNGLLVSNHSYGYNPSYLSDYQFGKYDADSRDFDAVMYNAPYYQMVCSAGNSRGTYNLVKNGYDLLTGHGVSKNAIDVAAVEEVPNYVDANSVVMSYFSSWGPTDDGRIKPDISAKGVNTFSSVAEGNSSYGNYSGTSMASPSVTGTLLLLQQYYNSLYGNYMKAASLKALMIHTADEAGLNPGPDYSFGWGLINAEKAANVIKNKNVFSFINEDTLNNAQEINISLKAKGNEPIVATLVWTDPAFTNLNTTLDDPTPNLVNDLDLVVTQNSTYHYPWKLNVANPSAAAVRGVNNVDNVEKIEIPNPNGVYLLKINHKGTLTNNLQNYSLVLSGVVNNDFWFTSNETTKNICKSVNTIDYTLSFHKISTFTDTVNLSAVNLPDGMTATFVPATISSEGNFTVTFNGISSVATGTYNIMIKGTSNSLEYEFPIVLKVFDENINPPTLSAPANQAISPSNTPVNFIWQQSPNTLNYLLEVSQNADFSNSTQVNSNTNSASLELSNGITYYWRVKSLNDCGTSEFSSANSFSIACAAPSNIVKTSATSTTLSVSWSGSATSQYEVEIVPQGQNPTGSGITVNTNSNTFQNLIKNTCYTIYVRAICTVGNSIWVSSNNLCTEPDYCAGDTFYDTGGASGNYSDNENWSKVIYPDVSTNRVIATINSLSLESYSDRFRVYDGNSTSGSLIFDSFSQFTIPKTLRANNSTGALTFNFTSDSSITYPGWDISILCAQKPDCAGIPTNLIKNSSTSNSVNVSWEDASNATQWEVAVVTEGTSPSTGVIVNTKNYSTNTLIKNTCYKVYVRALCQAGTSDWSDPLSFCTDPDYCAGDKFYDTGGASGNYNNGENWVKTIYPNTQGNRLAITFNTLSLENCCDRLTVYNGTNVSAPVLFTSSNYTTLPFTLKSTDIASGALTFAFTSDGSVTSSGWDASIVCEVMPACPEKPSNVTLGSATQTSLQLNWTENAQATQWEVELVQDGQNPTGIGTLISTKPYTFSSLNRNTCYKLYVRSKCSNGYSDWAVSGLFCTLADYCAGDRFYDSGGALSNYNNNENWTKTISPNNNGDRVKFFKNSFNVENYSDRFVVYNGPSTSYPILYDSYYNSTPIPDVLESTHIGTGSLTVLFTSNSQTTYSGWDFTVICEPMPPCPNLPTAITLTNATMTSLSVNWTENSQATQWEVEAVKDGQSATGIGTITSSKPLTIQNLERNTCYRIFVRSRCSGGNTDWVQSPLFCTLADYCAGDKFYDTGGVLSNYKDNENYTKTIYPKNSGDRVRVIFNSFVIPDRYGDVLTIYNGPNSTYPLLYRSYDNVNTLPTTYSSTNSTGALTFVFYSNSYSNGEGWDATVICEPMPPCSNPPSVINLLMATTNSLQVSWTENSQATQWEVETVIKDAIPTGVGTLVTTLPYTISNLQKNTCYDVYVRSVCTGGNSNWTKATLCTQPDYCAGDKFYDTGGASGSYTNGENWVKTIYPKNTTDKVRATFNSFSLETCCDYVTIYNGNTTSSPVLFYGSSMTVPRVFTSTHSTGALTFSFYSDSSSVSSGWEANIECGQFLGVNDVNFRNGLKIFPNPVIANVLTIRSVSTVKFYSIFDLTGKTVLEKMINKKDFDINLKNIPSGNYIINVVSNEGNSESLNFIKK